MSQTANKQDERRAMEAVRREMDSRVSPGVFAQLWDRARRSGDLTGYDPEQFVDNTSVREEAVEALRESVALARIGWEARGEQGDASPAKSRLLETRRPEPRKRNEDEAQNLQHSTVLRTEAMSLLIADLAGEREDVREYRETLPGLPTEDQVDDYLDNLDEEEADELLRIVLDVCECYGVRLPQSLDLVLGGTPPELKPLRVGPPTTGSSVCQMHFAFAPWVSTDDAAAALRGAQLRASKLREHNARAAERKREAIKRYEAGKTPKAKGLRPWLSDPQYTPPPRRPELDTSGGRVRGLHDDSVRVFLFVSRQRREIEGRQTWETLMKGFNALQEEDARHYTKARSFAKTYRRARATLLTWLPEPRPRLVLDGPEEG